MHIVDGKTDDHDGKQAAQTRENQAQTIQREIYVDTVGSTS